jgi:3-keto-5-aminohexanoate cleavage enzyme
VAADSEESPVPNKKVVVVVALNGGMQQDREGAHVPCSPAEVAEAAYRCWKAGAAVVHVHARDENRRNSSDPQIYSEIIRRIREKCDILVQTTNGIGVRRDPQTGQMIWPGDEERLKLLNVEPRPDLYGIAAGSADFYNPEGGYPDKDVPYINSIDLVRSTIRDVYARQATLEYEVIEVSSLYRLLRLANQGVFDRNQPNVWLLHGGGFGSTPPVARNLIFSIDEGQRLFPNALWGVTGTGKDQFWICTMGLAMGCDTVRVGFEDNIYLPSGKAAQHNSDLVDSIVKIAAIYGREPATPQEARQTFRLPARG